MNVSRASAKFARGGLWTLPWNSFRFFTHKSADLPYEICAQSLDLPYFRRGISKKAVFFPAAGAFSHSRGILSTLSSLCSPSPPLPSPKAKYHSDAEADSAIHGYAVSHSPKKILALCAIYLMRGAASVILSLIYLI
jgi:hypothetical protein